MNHLSAYWIALLLVLGVWELVWKALALWRAGQRRSLGWFIAIFVINSAGVLPIIYLATHRQQNQ